MFALRVLVHCVHVLITKKMGCLQEPAAVVKPQSLAKGPDDEKAKPKMAKFASEENLQAAFKDWDCMCTFVLL